MRRVLLALALQTPGPFVALTHARAEDSLVEHAERAEKTKQSIGEKIDAFANAASGGKERAVEQAKQASEKAQEAAERAKERTRRAADSLGERAHEAAESAQLYAGELKEDLGRRARQLGEDALGVVGGAKSALRNAMDGVREEARQILIGAAVALDNKTREARDAARKQHWDKLRARYKLPDARPTMAVSEELRDHEYRLARLQRARELAESAGDRASVARSDHLLELEYARHRHRLAQLIERQRKDLAQSTGEATAEAEP
jgi:hypothetical protein